jgi:geranylgeranyl pyrophosphate synthase
VNVFNLDAYLDERRRWIDAALLERIPPASGADPSGLRAAMRHAALEGGKRLRPVLCLAAAEAVGAAERPLGAACAVELVHAYSLVHDDLPAMDDAATRRGAPTVHKAFSEATAILAGDALLTLAFEMLAAEGSARAAEAYLRAAHELARAAGALGMVGGQAIDLEQKALPPATLRDLEACHAGKTAALFQAALAVGAICGLGSAEDVQALRGYGFDLGLAFQHADDLADGEHGALADKARARARDLCRRAAAAAERFGPRGRPLLAIADLVDRRAGDRPAV